WEIAEGIPLVRAEHHGLLQVLLNLVQNSCRAMENATDKLLNISVLSERNKANIRIKDSGPGVAHPEQLFQPFQPGADVNGLGLYVSRAIIRACGGNLRYERQDRGACFVVELACIGEVTKIADGSVKPAEGRQRTALTI